MRQIQRKRHEVIRFTARIAEHHTLITCPLILRIRSFHSLIDVIGLLMNRAQDTAGLGFKHVSTLGVPNATNHLTRNGLDV